MMTLYVLCAFTGSVMLLLLFILNFWGFGDDMDSHDFGHNAHHPIKGNDAFDVMDDLPVGQTSSTIFFHVLSLRAIVAALAFFGFGGILALEAGYGDIASVVSGLCGGMAAMLLVAWLMNMFYHLNTQGNISIKNALGQCANVYLTIPAAGGGAGKITVAVQDHSMEYDAITEGDGAIPTGEQVVVTKIINENTVAVEKAAKH